jgi:hypothetical protein
MVRKGGGDGARIIGDVLGTGLSMGTSYYAYKNSDTYGGFLWLRLKYGLMFFAFVAAIIGIPIILFMLFAKKTPIKTPPTSNVPVQPSK